MCALSGQGMYRKYYNHIVFIKLSHKTLKYGTISFGIKSDERNRRNTTFHIKENGSLYLQLEEGLPE